jgi:hypothetical protein
VTNESIWISGRHYQRRIWTEHFTMLKKPNGSQGGPAEHELAVKHPSICEREFPTTELYLAVANGTFTIFCPIEDDDLVFYSFSSN